jgi:hypothetical protein
VKGAVVATEIRRDNAGVTARLHLLITKPTNGNGRIIIIINNNNDDNTILSPSYNNDNNNIDNTMASHNTNNDIYYGSRI